MKENVKIGFLGLGKIGETIALGLLQITLIKGVLAAAKRSAEINRYFIMYA